MKNLYLSILLLLLLQSCTLSSFQTGKTVPKGTASHGLFLSNTLWGVNYQCRYGLLKKMDIGFVTSAIYPQFIDIKYNLLPSNSKFAFAIGTTALPLTQFQAPIHFSYHPNDKLAFYSTGRYANIGWWWWNKNINYQDPAQALTLVFGVKMEGKNSRRSFICEGGMAHNIGDRYLVPDSQNYPLFSMGIAWRLP